MKKIVALLMFVLLCMTAFVGCDGYGEQTYDTEYFSVTAGGKWEKLDMDGAALTLGYTEFFGDNQCYMAFINSPADGYELDAYVESMEYNLAAQPTFQVRKSEAATVAGRSGYEITGSATESDYSFRFSYKMFIENDIYFCIYILVPSEQYSVLESKIDTVLSTLEVK